MPHSLGATENGTRDPIPFRPQGQIMGLEGGFSLCVKARFKIWGHKDISYDRRGKWQIIWYQQSTFTYMSCHFSCPFYDNSGDVHVLFQKQGLSCCWSERQARVWEVEDTLNSLLSFSGSVEGLFCIPGFSQIPHGFTSVSAKTFFIWAMLDANLLNLIENLSQTLLDFHLTASRHSQGLKSQSPSVIQGHPGASEVGRAGSP